MIVLNPSEVKRVGHTIKGAARSIGALPLAKLAEIAEEEGHFELEAINQEMEKIAPTLLKSLINLKTTAIIFSWSFFGRTAEARI